MSDLENSLPNQIENLAPSAELSALQQQRPRVGLQEVAATAEMLAGFREGVKEGTFKGKHLIHIAQGLMFLDNMVRQSQMDLNRARQEEENMKKMAKEAIKQAGGKIEQAS